MDELNIDGQREKPEPGAPAQPKRATRRYAAIAIALITLISIAFAVARRADTTPVSSTAAQPATAPTDIIEATLEQLRQVRVEEVREENVGLDLETTGKVGFDEDKMTPVFAPYSGRVLEVLVNKGDLVKAGQPLLVVESPELVAAINDLSQAGADADKAKIALESADKAAQRARTLNAQEALAAKDLQAAESDLARAREDYRRAQAAVSVIRNRLALFGKNEQEIARWEESVTDQIDKRIIIRAPLAGTIVDRKVGPGQYIKPDTPDPLYLISDLSNVWVNADVYESALSQIHIGAPTEISVAAYPERKFAARVAAINPTLDAAARTVHVRCIVPNSGGLLKPEMFASIRIGGEAKRRVPVVPSSAVLTQGPDSFVFVEEGDGRFRRRRIATGRENRGYTIIEKGLNANERVVTTGVLLLNNGLDAK